ncbi:helix-turn-helix transcriptional regulator [Bosea sp. (in: a-proteobacteria)]|uniref:helix-turn-helix transcriptional regulator n=1 Tax=Bosea sp. (in: a-proteobacteria) TaxID=1871050 RepID=UPI00333E7B2D
MPGDSAVFAIERDLTDLIYAALLGEGSWQAFLDRLNEIVPGGISTLFFHDHGLARGGISLASGLEAGIAEAYAAYYVGVNPWMRNVAATPLRIGIVGERIVPREDFIRTEYYADFLRKREIEAGVGVTLWREETCSFLLSTLTSRIAPEENQQIADLLSRLSPHLVRAFRYYRAGRFGSVAAQFGSSLLESPQIGVVIVGEGMKVRAISPAGERCLAAGTVVGLGPTGKLRLRDDGAALLLRQMLSRSHAGARSRILHLGSHRLTIIRNDSEGENGYFSGPTAALLIEEAQPEATAADIDWLTRRFGLTRAEARVAAGISKGLTLAMIAGQAGISQETVRVQLKAVYAKTGVNSQAALVRLALAHRAR